ncbi:hypothetical protein Hanom_Chr00s001080g01673701 [Helianthus anomalus]
MLQSSIAYELCFMSSIAYELCFMVVLMLIMTIWVCNVICILFVGPVMLLLANVQLA